MKRILLVMMAFFAMTPYIWAGDKNKQTKKTKATTSVAANKEIEWISLDDLQMKMKEKPKKVYMDVYTDWCGWCKRMEATTFQNPDLIKYMNDNFYCIRLNAERKDTIRFVGHMYYFDPAQRANTLAVELLHGKLGYPTSVFMEENFVSASPVEGFHDVKEMESIIKFFGDNVYKHQAWADYQKEFKPAFRVDNNAPAPPMGNMH